MYKPQVFGKIFVKKLQFQKKSNLKNYDQNVA